jgi:hypothetical protein
MSLTNSEPATNASPACFQNVNATGHEVLDLRALRPLAMRGLEGWNSDVVRTIHGYDAAVIWKGGTCLFVLR